MFRSVQRVRPALAHAVAPVAASPPPLPSVLRRDLLLLVLLKKLAGVMKKCLPPLRVAVVPQGVAPAVVVLAVARAQEVAVEKRRVRVANPGLEKARVLVDLVNLAVLVALAVAVAALVVARGQAPAHVVAKSLLH